mmetsp:Transcript_148117/g.261189  ORF Transcript_148117/g.261189 Transcript_148117/m.261189 type:complete len:462 (+) Transcript_148117:156-1541(+)
MADANPLNNSLPAEVVLRRRPPAVRKVDTDEVEVDLKVALACKPEARIKWITKACAMAKSGRASSRDLFDIIANKRFTAGLPFKIGRRIASIAHENRMLFSERQQRYMQSSEWILNAKYGLDVAETRHDEDSDDDDECDAVSASLQHQNTNLADKKSNEDGDGIEARMSVVRLDRKRIWEDALENRRRGEGRERRARWEERRNDLEVNPKDDREDSVRREDLERRFAEGGPGQQLRSQERSRVADEAAEDLTEEDQQARREALEKRLAAEERERQLRREQRKRQAEDATNVFSAAFGEAQQMKKQQLEEEVDSSLQMLERLTQRQQPPEEAPPPRRRRRRRHDSRSRSNPLRLIENAASRPDYATGRPDYAAGRRRRRRAMSRSRSISVQAASMSPSPTSTRFKAAPGETFEEALARRMSQRDAEMDSARIPVTWKREEMRRGMHMPIRAKRVTSGKRFIS